MKWKTWLGVAVSAVFLALAFRKFEFQEMGSSLRQANYLYLIPVFALTILTFWLRAYRWKFFLESVKQINTHTLFSATMIGFMANNLLPARLGEFVRAYAIGRREQISKSASFATIVVERIFDGLTLLLFMYVVLIFLPLFPSWIKRSALIALIIYLGALALLFLLNVKTQRTLNIASFVLRFLPDRITEKVVHVLESFASGLSVLSQMHHLLVVFLLSLVIWGLFVATIYCTFFAFNFGLPLYAAVTLLVILSIGVMLPSSPGFVGTFQFFCVVGLGLFNISESAALSYSIVLHASQYIPVTAIGLLYFWRENLSFREISSQSPESQPLDKGD